MHSERSDKQGRDEGEHREGEETSFGEMHASGRPLLEGPSRGEVSNAEEASAKNSETITPEQKALLGRPNSDQYPTERELSTGKVTKKSGNSKSMGKKMKDTVKKNDCGKPSYHRSGDVTPLSSEERLLHDVEIEHAKTAVLEVITDKEVHRVLDSMNGKDAKLSKSIIKRKKWINNYVEEKCASSGRDKKEIRAKLLQKMAEAKRDAKDLYEKVLAGDFNKVTLQLINNYIDHATNNERFYRPLSQRLRERALLSLHEGGRTGSVDALFSRICESTVPKNGRASAHGRRRIEEKKEELLEKWAKATGNWHESVEDFTDETIPIGSGTDSDVYLSNDGKTVIKASKGKFDKKKFPSDVDQVALFNSVFPHSAYRILGYGRQNGHFVKFLEQSFVDFSTSFPLTTEERVDYMRELGFEPKNEENTVFSDSEIVVSDLQKSNIVRDAAGNIRVIDADVKLHTKDIGGKWTYPDVETDTELPNYMLQIN